MADIVDRSNDSSGVYQGFLKWVENRVDDDLSAMSDDLKIVVECDHVGEIPVYELSFYPVFDEDHEIYNFNVGRKSLKRVSNRESGELDESNSLKRTWFTMRNKIAAKLEKHYQEGE